VRSAARKSGHRFSSRPRDRQKGLTPSQPRGHLTRTGLSSRCGHGNHSLLGKNVGKRLPLRQDSKSKTRVRRRSSSDSRGNTRDKIKAVATKLLITHGVRGFSYADIAERLSITTTNIHHHFGKKEHLVDEVVRDYVADASSRHKEIWTDSSLSLNEKIQKFIAFNFERYSRFNRGKREGRPWSLIGRLRLDSESLSTDSVRALASFGSDVQEFIHVAVTRARDEGELRSDTPVNDIALLLANMVNSTAIFTQVSGNFAVVRDCFGSATRVIFSGYGTGRAHSVIAATSMRPNSERVS
jgi:TetR/AcrR family transcriptional repressor of nem operon